MYRSLSLVLIAACAVALPRPASSSDALATSAATAGAAADEPACFSGGVMEAFWSKVGQRICLKCHHSDGDAAGSELLLGDEFAAAPQQRGELIAKNFAALVALARQSDQQGQSRLLLKARGELDHGGGEVLAADSSELRLLSEFVAHARCDSAAISFSAAEMSDRDDDPHDAGCGMRGVSPHH